MGDNRNLREKRKDDRKVENILREMAIMTEIVTPVQDKNFEFKEPASQKKTTGESTNQNRASGEAGTQKKSKAELVSQKKPGKEPVPQKKPGSKKGVSETKELVSRKSDTDDSSKSVKKAASPK